MPNELINGLRKVSQFRMITKKGKDGDINGVKRKEKAHTQRERERENWLMAYQPVLGYSMKSYLLYVSIYIF